MMLAGEFVAKADAQRYHEEGFWRPQTLWSDLTAILESRPDHVAFEVDDRTLTVAETHHAAGVLADRLRELGVERGDIVAVLGRNSLEAAVAFVATVRLGAVLAPVAPMFGAAQLGSLLKQCDARALIALGGEREIEKCASLPEDTHRLLAFEPRLLDELLAAPASQTEPTPIDPDEPNLILHSSGTTSIPKAIVHSGNTLRYTTERLGECWELSDGDVFLLVTEFGFVGSTLFGYFAALLIGARCVLGRRWDPDGALKLMQDKRITYVLLVPTHVSDLLNDADPKSYDFSAMRALVAPGLTREQRQKVREAFGRLPIGDYGLSEVPGNCTHGLSEPDEKLAKTEGTPFRGTEIRIVDDNGEPLPDGEKGNVEVNGPSRFFGFLNNEELTRELLAPWGGYRTGDIGYLDEDGQLVYVGRVKDTIERAGVQIVPADIEPSVLEHPAVREVALVPLPHERLGETICAAVILIEGASEPSLEELQEFLDGKGVAKYTWPESIEVFDDFPRTSSLKPVKGDIVKRVLARRPAADRG